MGINGLAVQNKFDTIAVAADKDILPINCR